MSSRPETLEEVVAALKLATAEPGTNILALMEAAGLNPKQDFRGGKWRYRDFSGLDLNGCNFKGSDLRGANFDDANIANARFQGAEISPKNIIKAQHWRQAQYDDEQLLALTRLTLQSLPFDERLSLITAMPTISEREWVAIIKAEVNRSYSNARRLLQIMNARGLPPSPFAYSAIISEAAEASAHRDYSEFIELGGVPDEALISTVIDRVGSFSQALELIDDAHDRNFKLSAYGFNSAFRIAVKDAHGIRDKIKSAISDLQDRGMTFDEISYNILLRTVSRSGEAIAVCERMSSDGLTPRVHEINQALRSVRDGEIEKILQFAEDNNIEFNNITYNIIIGSQNSAFDAVPWLDRMIAAGFPADLYTLRAILRCSADTVDAAVGLTFLRRRGFDVYRREAVSGVAELTGDTAITSWVTKMWENMTTPEDAMRRLFDRIFDQEPRTRFFWSLLR